MKSARDWYGPDASKWLGENDEDEELHHPYEQEVLWALSDGIDTAVKWMYYVGCLDLTVQFNGSTTPCLALAFHGRHSLLNWMHARGLANVNNEKDDDGRNMMHLAAYNGHESILAWLKSIQALDTKERDDQGYTVALLASLKGRDSVLKWMHSEGILDLKERDRKGMTPALLAAYMGHDHIVVWLHSQGLLDMTEKDGDGRSLEELATKPGRKSLLDWLRSKNLLSGIASQQIE